MTCTGSGSLGAKPWHDGQTKLFDYLGSWSTTVFEIEDDVIHTDPLEGFQQLQEIVSPKPEPQMDRSRRRRGMRVEIDVKGLEEWLVDITHLRRDCLAPSLHNLLLRLGWAWICYPTAALPRDPLKGLTTVACYEERDLIRRRFRDQVSVCEKSATPLQGLETGTLRAPNDIQVLAKDFSPFIRIQSERGKFDGSIARRDAKEQPTLAELVHASCGLRGMQRMAQWDRN